MSRWRASLEIHKRWFRQWLGLEIHRASHSAITYSCRKHQYHINFKLVLKMQLMLAIPVSIVSILVLTIIIVGGKSLISVKANLVMLTALIILLLTGDRFRPICPVMSISRASVASTRRATVSSYIERPSARAAIGASTCYLRANAYFV